jgi:hypothetical protein
MREIYERNGVRYEVTLEPRDGKFLGSWRCLTCNQTGGSDHAYISAAEAVGVAKADSFTEHHLPVHLLNQPHRHLGGQE